MWIPSNTWAVGDFSRNCRDIIYRYPRILYRITRREKQRLAM
jgi:hypothetical protein